MKPGRPVFATLIERIEKGEAQGIVAWAPDRLARNSIDGGQIIYLLDRGIIRDLKFATYTFEDNSQGKFMLQIMFGQSKYYSDALSENVKRGVRTKIENGWWPTIAPLGYRNDAETKTIAVDTKRFPLIRKMFDMLLTGAYGAEQIWTAANEWGFRTPQRRVLGGRPLALSTIYKIFYNPFYAGIIEWNGKWYPGKHAPVISLAEYERVQAILRRPGRPQPQKHQFAYTGLMRCGSCGFMITAEKKINRFGSAYTYYHCSWRARPKCKERSVEVGNLEVQFRDFLSGLCLPDSARQWALTVLETEKAAAVEHSDSKRHALASAINAAERKSDQLTDMRARSLIEDTEFIAKREQVQRELLQLRQSLAACDADGDSWFEPAKSILSFSNRAVSWFEEGTDEEKRLIMHSVGSNLSLRRRIASIQAKKIYRSVPKNRDFLSWRAFVKNIRKMAGNGTLDETMNSLTKLAELRALRGADVCVPQPRSGAALRERGTRREGVKLPHERLRKKYPRHRHRDIFA